MISFIDILPKDIYESIHYKLLYRLKNFIHNKDHPNIIISGNKGCGKSTIIKLLFKDLVFNRDSINPDFYMINNDIYYYFDCKNILNKNQFIEYLKKVCKSYDYSLRSKYIILDSFENVNEYIQNCLKVIIEKCSTISKFIIVCSNNDFIISALRSRCISMIVNEPKYYDKFIYLKKLFKDNNIIYNDFLLLEQCNIENLNNVIYNHISNDNYKNMVRIYLDKVIHLFYNKFSLKEIKLLSQTLKELNISYILEKPLIDRLEMITNKKKLIMIIKEITMYNHNIKNSYRDILFVEGLLIKIYNIINELL